MEISPYLLFNGNCADAFKFYEQSLGGKITFIQKFGESPMADQVPADWRDKIAHTPMNSGRRRLIASTKPPAHYAAPQGVSVVLSPSNTEEGERMFNAPPTSVRACMPFQKTFWSPGFGMTVDRFGISWIVNCEGTP